MWGDSSLWYRLAEANGLTAASALVEGQSLTVPAGVSSNGFSASTFRPYDPAEAVGETSPTSPKPNKKNNKCGVFGAILLVAIAVAVTALTAGAAVAALAPASAGITGIGSALTAIAAVKTGLGIATLAGIGAVAGAAGSIASQGFGVATGIQDSFSWKSVAMAGIAGGISGGLGAAIPGGQLSTLSAIGRGAVIGAGTSALSQGIGLAIGLQKKFDFAGVAAAGLAGAVSSGVGKMLRAGSLADMSARNIGANLATSAAGAITNATVRTLANGTSFGDNLIAALPDIIGSTIGNMIAGAVEGDSRQNQLNQAIEQALRASSGEGELYSLLNMGGSGGVDDYEPENDWERGAYENALRQTGDESMARAVALAVHLKSVVDHTFDLAVNAPGPGAQALLAEISAFRRLLGYQLMALDSYLPEGVPELLPEGYHRMTEQEINSVGLTERDINDPNSGYFASLYKNQHSGEIVFANRGSTSSMKIWRQNFLQAGGKETPIYNRAVDAARRLATYDGIVTFVGHSLGGGLATLQGLITGRQAIVFNSAGLHENTMTQFQLNPRAARSNIYALNTSLDPLTFFQDTGTSITDRPRAVPFVGPQLDKILFSSPRVQGVRVEIPSVYYQSVAGGHTYTPGTSFSSNPVEYSRQALYYHSMIGTIVASVHVLENRDINWRAAR